MYSRPIPNQPAHRLSTHRLPTARLPTARLPDCPTARLPDFVHPIIQHPTPDHPITQRRTDIDLDLDLSGPFRLPLWFDYSATFVWALSGALIAARRRFDIAGIAALALVSATGGGLLRDGIFLQISPPLFLRSGVYITLVVVAATVVNLAGSRIQRIPFFDRTIALVDAFGLGGFAITGLELSLNAGLSTPAAIFVGIVNAVGGGVLRDVLVQRDVSIFLPGPPAALAALAGCIVYSLLTRVTDLGGALAGIVAVSAVFVIRVAAIRYGWQTKPPAGFDASETRED